MALLAQRTKTHDEPVKFTAPAPALLTIALVLGSAILATSSTDEPPPITAVGSTAEVSGFVSDDFNTTTLGPQWQLVDPLSDSVVGLSGAGTANAQLDISIPAGTSHDAWRPNDAVRLVQPIFDTDFELEVGFTTIPSQRYQFQGILVEQDALNWARLDVYHDGGKLRLFAARSIAGRPRRQLSMVVPADTSRLRLKRTTDTWSAYYSPDGTDWQFAGSFDFVMVPRDAGVLAGNAGPNPAFLSSVDYVFDTAAPLLPEDGVADPTPTSTGLPVPTLPPSPSPSPSPSPTVALAATPTPPVGPTATPPPGATATETPTNDGVIDVWYGPSQLFGDDGVPQQFVNVLGSASDSDGINSLSFRLNAGAPRDLTVGSDLRRVYNPGDFNVEINTSDLNLGTNDVLLTLVDSLGNVSTQAVTVIWEPAAPPTLYMTDWASATAPSDGAQVVDGKWTINGGELRTLETGYDRAIAIGDQTWENYEVEVPVTVYSLAPGSGTQQSGQPLVGMGLRWLGHSPVQNRQPNWGFWPTGAFAWYRLHATTNGLNIMGNNGQPKTKQPFDLTYGATYVFKARAQTVAGGTDYKFKAWLQGTEEPGQWHVEILEPDGPASGSVLLLAHHLDVAFGDVIITPLP